MYVAYYQNNLYPRSFGHRETLYLTQTVRCPLHITKCCGAKKGIIILSVSAQMYSVIPNIWKARRTFVNVY